MSTEIKPFSFTDLPKLSRKEVQLNNLFFSNLFSFERKDNLQKKIADTLHELLQKNATATLDNVEIVQLNDYLKSSSENNCFCIISFPPKTGLFFLEISFELAKSLIYSILGKEGQIPTQSQILTEVEKGILGYIILKLLSILQEPEHNISGGQFQLINFFQDSKELSNYFENSFLFTAINFKLKLDQQQFFFRLLLSSDLTKNLATSLRDLDDNSSIWLACKRTFAVQVPLIAEIGQVSLHINDFKSLDVDDIIVLEGNHLQLKSLGLMGDVICKIGESEFGSLRGSLLLTKNGHYAVQVKDIMSARNLK